MGGLRCGSTALAWTQIVALWSATHEASCRGLAFDSTGQFLYTISADKHFRMLNNSGKETLKFHTGDDKLNKMLMLDNNNLVTGDDSGCVKLWDLRTDNSKSGTGIMEWNVHPRLHLSAVLVSLTRIKPC